MHGEALHWLTAPCHLYKILSNLAKLFSAVPSSALLCTAVRCLASPRHVGRELGNGNLLNYATVSLAPPVTASHCL